VEVYCSIEVFYDRGVSLDRRRKRTILVDFTAINAPYTLIRSLLLSAFSKIYGHPSVSKEKLLKSTKARTQVLADGRSQRVKVYEEGARKYSPWKRAMV